MGEKDKLNQRKRQIETKEKIMGRTKKKKKITQSKKRKHHKKERKTKKKRKKDRKKERKKEREARTGNTGPSHSSWALGAAQSLNTHSIQKITIQ